LHLHIAQDEEADALISEDPLALLIAMVLDQQVPLEWAFSAPLRLRQRLGESLDAGRIAAMDPDELGKAFSERPALHRFPGSNAKRVHQLCQLIVDDYDGRPEAIWETATTGDELYARVKALPGFGEQKARIFVGLLGKQLAVRPPGWEDAARPFGQPGTYLSVADIVDRASLDRVRAYKQEKKAAARA
jgi:uncharacterized HhH-GPD family protein